MWDHTLNDWRWALDVNVWGVIHGIKAFVPTMIEQGEAGHVVNTSSGNGGVSPLPGTPIYATTKAAVVTITECLYAQLQSVGAPIGASVLYPGPKMLRTGLFSSWRNRPPELANPTPRTTPPTTIESFEKRMADAGVTVDYTPVEEVAERVIAAVRDEHVLDPAPRATGPTPRSPPARRRCSPAPTPTTSETSPAELSRESSRSVNPYLVISADCHAGLPNEQYRAYLDPEYREQFDAHLAERTRMLELAQRGLLNEEFAEAVERRERRGPARRMGRRPPRQGARTRTASSARSSFPTPTP